MKKSVALAVMCALLAGCSTLDSINPFSKSGPKMAELKSIKSSVELRVRWKENVGKGGIYAFSPAIVGDAVFAASNDGYLYRLEDGKTIWRIKTGVTLSGGVGADDSTVVVGTTAGKLLAYSAKDGAKIWESDATSTVLAPPTLSGGVVVVRTGDNRLAAYDQFSGVRKWIYQRPTPALALRVTAAPVVDGQFVFAGFPGGKLIAVKLDSGVAVWEGTVALPKGATELERIADITSAPKIAAGVVCAVAYQGKATCFDLTNGNSMWSRDVSSSAGLSIGNRAVYVSDDRGALIAYDAKTGTNLWKQDALSLRRLTAPVEYRGYVVVGDAEGVVHFINPEDGSFAGRIQTDGSPMLTDFRITGTTLIVQTSKGGVYAIETQ